jgi:hypothetical protein
MHEPQVLTEPHAADVVGGDARQGFWPQAEMVRNGPGLPPQCVNTAAQRRRADGYCPNSEVSVLIRINCCPNLLLNF